MQKLTIGLKLDDKVAYLKTYEIQENSIIMQKLINILTIFTEHNFIKENENAKNEHNG